MTVLSLGRRDGLSTSSEPDQALQQADPSADDSSLELRAVSHRFPGVLALDGVDFAARKGEVHALVGENGAGKSTLVKVAAGLIAPDTGSVKVGGRPLVKASPLLARKLGLRIVPQERHIVLDRSVAENVLLDRLPIGPLGFVSRRKVLRAANDQLEALGIGIDPQRPARDLAVAEQQLVEIARAVSFDAHVLILDEPTASLQPEEASKLFEIVEQLRRHDVAVVYVSHHLNEVFELADRVTVLRDGTVAGTRPITHTTSTELLELIFGRSVDASRSAIRPTEPPIQGSPIVQVADVHFGAILKGVSLTLRRGEVVALTGSSGSGASALARVVAGASQPTAGHVIHLLSGSPPRTRADHACHGIAFLPADRKRHGLLLDRSVTENINLSYGTTSKERLYRPRNDHRRAIRACDELAIRCPDPRVPVRQLSGGNQQKVMLARWLTIGASVLVFDEPTAGVDVASKVELYAHLLRAAEEGAAILMVSSDYEEIQAVADRVLVLRDGRIVAELDGEKADGTHIMQAEMDA